MSKPVLFILATVLTQLAVAAEIPAGDRLPDLSITDRGELVLQGDDVGYRNWSYSQDPGKVHIVQYMAATKRASEINKPFTDRMKTDLPKGGVFMSTTIVNLDEAMWGTGGFVVGELKSNKVKFPDAVLVADEDGAGLKQWQLQSDSSALIVTDAGGVVRYFKQGALSPAEIESTLALVREYIGKSTGIAAGSGSASGTP